MVLALRNYGGSAHKCPNIQVRLISFNAQYVGARRFLKKLDVKVVLPDELRQHPHSPMCLNAIDVNFGYA